MTDADRRLSQRTSFAEPVIPSVSSSSSRRCSLAKIDGNADLSHARKRFCLFVRPLEPSAPVLEFDVPPSPPVRRRSLLHLRPSRRFTTPPSTIQSSQEHRQSPQQNDSLPEAFQFMRHLFQPLDMNRMTAACDHCGALH